MRYIIPLFLFFTHAAQAQTIRLQVKNNTSSPVFIDDIGRGVSASSTEDIDPTNYLLWAASEDIDTYIDNDTLDIIDLTFGTPLTLTNEDAKSYIHELRISRLQRTGGQSFNQVRDIEFDGDVSVADLGNGHVKVSVGVQSFSDSYDYAYAKSEDTSSTTSNSFVQKLRLTTPSLMAGDYRISWYFEANVSSHNSEIRYRVELDDTELLAEPIYEPRDKEWHSASGWDVRNMTPGIHTIDIDYKSMTNKTAKIRRARLEIWRVD